MEIFFFSAFTEKKVRFLTILLSSHVKSKWTMREKLTIFWRLERRQRTTLSSILVRGVYETTCFRLDLKQNLIIFSFLFWLSMARKNTLKKYVANVKIHTIKKSHWKKKKKWEKIGKNWRLEKNWQLKYWTILKLDIFDDNKTVRKLTLQTYSGVPNKRTGTRINFRIAVLKKNHF